MKLTKKELQNLIKEAVKEETLSSMSDESLAFNVLEVAELLALQIKDRKFGGYAKSAVRKYARELLVLAQEAIKRQDKSDPSRLADVDGPRSGISVDEQTAKGNGLVTTTAAQQSEKSEKDMVVEMPSESNWIKKAIEKPGSLRKTAQQKGLVKGDENLSNADLDKLEKMGGKTAKRAQLAKTLKNLDEDSEDLSDLNC